MMLEIGVGRVALSAPCGCSMTCPQCGVESSLDAMCETPVGGPLPRGQFQCPVCHYAFQRREVEPGTTWRSGNAVCYVPGRLGLVPCERRL